ncbi:MAG: hypothetical protein ACR2NJ_05880 [Acidimicrobiales bacterium]
MVRLAWAALLLAAPARILDAIGGPVDPTSVTVARILGARHAIQGMVEVATWPQWRRPGSLVDAAHSLTAAGLGVSAARWRRIGLADSVIAAAFAVAGLAGRQPAEGILRSNSNSQPTSNR